MFIMIACFAGGSTDFKKGFRFKKKKTLSVRKGEKLQVQLVEPRGLMIRL